ncbi:MAG TPA: PorT family protein, partial [Saprospiraceae bacterium]|nr:PorT family protein [Saprospiraceae bacterium]
MKYRNLIVSFLFVLVTIGYTNAQTDTTAIKTKSVETDNYVPQSDFRTVRLGIFGTIGSSWMKPKTTGYESQGSKLAYSYGLLVDYNFTENYTFSSGVSFNSLGGNLSYQDSAIVSGNTKAIGTLNRSYRINFIEIPTLLKLKTNQMGYFTYFAQLGLRHNFRVSSFADDNFIYDNPSKTLTSEDQEMKEYTSFYRLSFSFALGAEYALSQTFS